MGIAEPGQWARIQPPRRKERQEPDTWRLGVLAVQFLLSLLPLFCPVAAQLSGGVISGIVRDPSGALVPGVLIELKNMDSGIKRTLISGQEGTFRIPGLVPGRYRLKLQKSGFEDFVSELIPLSFEQRLALEFMLRLHSPLATLTVSESPPVPAAVGELLEGWIDPERIAGIPLNGRNVVDLALLEAGVNAFPQRPAASDAPIFNHGSWFSVNGSGVRSNSFLLDGIPNQNPSAAASGSIVGTSLGVEGIREFHVLKGAYSAEYGRVSGGVIHAATRSGTNQLHGSTFGFFRNDALDARNFFDADNQPDFARSQFGFAVGGPIRKDRSFFFTNTERLREDLDVTRVSPVPTLASREGEVAAAVKPFLDLFPEPNGRELGGGLALFSFQQTQPTREWFHLSRWDHALSSEVQLFARYLLDRASIERPASYPLFETLSESDHQNFAFSVQWIPHQNWLGVTRVGKVVSDLEEENLTRFDPAPFKVDPAAATFPQIAIGSLPIFGPTAVPRLRLRQDLWTVSQDVTFSRGNHTIQFGTLLDFNRLRRLGTAFESGRFLFANLDAFRNADPFLFIGTTRDSVQSFDFSNRFHSWYLQYRFRLGSRLSLQVGLRAERATVPEEKGGASGSLRDVVEDDHVTVGPPFENPGTTWEPRLGFSWQLVPKLVLRGGFGLHADFQQLPFATHIAATGLPPFIERVTLVRPSFPNPPLQGPTGRSSPQTLEFNLKTPRSRHVGLQLERRLRNDFTVAVGYAGSFGENLLRRGDVNLAIPQHVEEGRLFFPPDASRKNPAFGAVTLIRSDGSSNYHALNVSLRKRFGGKLGLHGFYLFSRTLDAGSAQVLALDAGGGAGNVFNPLQPKAEYGPADFHAAHRFSLDFSVFLPGPAGGGRWQQAMLSNWMLHGLIRWTSGHPFDVFVNANRSRSLFGSPAPSGQGLDRPNLAPGRSPRDAILGGPDQFFDPTAFELQPAGFFGNLGRNSLIGPGFENVDLALVKTQSLSADERVQLQLRLEVFNLFNHPNFGFPDRVVFAGSAPSEQPLAGAGVIRETVSSSRQFQIAVRLNF